MATLKLLRSQISALPERRPRTILFIASQPFDSDQYDMRIDHQFS